MDRLNKEILRLALPSILANITVPLVGMADIAVGGHLPAGEGPGVASFIGALSVGSMLFSLLYWNFAFLRAGTGGLTAQSLGRGDMRECASIFARAIALSAALAVLVLALQRPFLKLALMVTDGTPEVEELASRYFLIRIWAAPATIALMAFSGWFVGMQDSVSSMWKDLIVNCVNIPASIILSLGAGPFRGLGFEGIALGTVIAQYSGLIFCIIVSLVKYRKVLSLFSLSDLPSMLSGHELRSFFRMNMDLFGRSLCFTAIYLGYTMIAAGFGDMMLACSAIMMQLLMLFSFFTDGFAYAGEALTGRFIGAMDRLMMTRTVKLVFIWSMSIATLFIGIYWFAGVPLLRMMTSDPDVVEACRAFLPWLVLMPPLGCAAFTWDGIYLGATASRPIFISMLGAAVSFLAVWFSARELASPSGVPALHWLLAAYFAHLAFRTVYLSLRYRRDVRSRV